jgi:hypothetical protein
VLFDPFVPDVVLEERGNRQAVDGAVAHWCVGDEAFGVVPFLPCKVGAPVWCWFAE